MPIMNAPVRMETLFCFMSATTSSYALIMIRSNFSLTSVSFQLRAWMFWDPLEIGDRHPSGVGEDIGHNGDVAVVD